MKRIAALDGLRAYLAVWVALCHIQRFSYSAAEIARFTGAPKLLNEADYAVDLFMALSGFVIFDLLDTRRERYGPFLIRRFFRLYPLYLLLFLAALAAVPAAGYVYHLQAPDWTYRPWADWPGKVGLHLLLLHGVAPAGWFGPVSDQAYLPPAWSVSLEWQFYLVAPLVFWAFQRGRAGRLAALAGAVGVALLAPQLTGFDGFLPVHLDFFCYGIAGYYLYRAGWLRPAGGDVVFPAAVVLGVLLFLACVRLPLLLPVIFWIMFLALLHEPGDALSARGVLPVFTNGVAQYLGKISYGIYLSHYLVLLGCEVAIRQLWPAATGLGHFALLAGTVLPLTAGVSALLHRQVEGPGMEWGRRAALAWANRRAPLNHLPLPAGKNP